MERRFRLQRSDDVRRVYDEGKAWPHPLLTLILRPNGLDRTRLGFTAGRSVGGAVRRNRAKRLMREAARRLFDQFGVGWDVMVIARPRMREVQESQVEAALASLLRRARLQEEQRGIYPTASTVGEGRA